MLALYWQQYEDLPCPRPVAAVSDGLDRAPACQRHTQREPSSSSTTMPGRPVPKSG